MSRTQEANQRPELGLSIGRKPDRTDQDRSPVRSVFGRSECGRSGPVHPVRLPSPIQNEWRSKTLNVYNTKLWINFLNEVSTIFKMLDRWTHMHFSKYLCLLDRDLNLIFHVTFFLNMSLPSPHNKNSSIRHNHLVNNIMWWKSIIMTCKIIGIHLKAA